MQRVLAPGCSGSGKLTFAIRFARMRVACMPRILTLVLTSDRRIRRDPARRCSEEFDVGFLKRVWNFPRDQTPNFLRAMELHGACGRAIVRKPVRESPDYLQRVAMNMA